MLNSINKERMTTSIHPFPARMAPEIALKHVLSLRPNSLVLDPMVGSGTVLWHASIKGHRSIGFDLDPLAVLMSRVRTTSINIAVFNDLSSYVVERVVALKQHKLVLPWIDSDEETKKFIDFWFAKKQIQQLRVLAFVLMTDPKILTNPSVADALRLCLSKLIVTKKYGASLAWDVSHSRPHKVKEENDYDVFNEFIKSAKKLGKQLQDSVPIGDAEVIIGDARTLDVLKPNSIDAVITSPPYLNAIDYMRGHKLSLVWLGCTIRDLRAIRSSSIGAERSADSDESTQNRLATIFSAFGELSDLPVKHRKMIFRYAVDISKFTAEIARVLKPGGKCVFVVGNSCLKGIFINNSKAVALASQLAGLKLIEESERELPSGSRYLPIPVTQDNALGRRMRNEVVMVLKKPSRVRKGLMS
jgi:tRNA G10  N-methylase Trm11